MGVDPGSDDEDVLEDPLADDDDEPTGSGDWGFLGLMIMICCKSFLSSEIVGDGNDNGPFIEECDDDAYGIGGLATPARYSLVTLTIPDMWRMFQHADSKLLPELTVICT